MTGLHWDWSPLWLVSTGTGLHTDWSPQGLSFPVITSLVFHVCLQCGQHIRIYRCLSLFLVVKYVEAAVSASSWVVCVSLSTRHVSVALPDLAIFFALRAFDLSCTWCTSPVACLCSVDTLKFTGHKVVLSTEHCNHACSPYTSRWVVHAVYHPPWNSTCMKYGACNLLWSMYVCMTPQPGSCFLRSDLEVEILVSPARLREHGDCHGCQLIALDIIDINVSWTY